MARRSRDTGQRSKILVAPFQRDLTARRSLTIELPEFVICALETRVGEANEQAPPHERSTLTDYIETELVNLVTLRDVAELEYRIPGFARAVNQWLHEIGE